MLFLVNVLRELKPRESGEAALSDEMRNAQNISVVNLQESEEFEM
jgi:hypothetical protein